MFKFKKSDEVKTSPLTKKSNAVAKATMFFATLIATMFCFAVTASADDDPLTVVNNLSTFIFGLIRAVGLIILAWGIVQVRSKMSFSIDNIIFDCRNKSFIKFLFM